MKLLDLTETLVEVLRNTIPNPHPSGNWVYSDYPRRDVTFPRISITQVSGSLSEIGIGKWTENKKGELCTIDYDIDIWVKVGDRTIINNTTYVGTALRDKYAELVISSLQNSRESLKAEKGILDIEFISVTSIPLDEENMLHRKTITIRVTFVWDIT